MIYLQGLPGDEWPGIPGAGWGMGSRVRCRMISGGVQMGMVVGASRGGTEHWIIHVRLEYIGKRSPPMMFRPSELRSAT